MKEHICAGLGMVGGAVAAFFGGWDAAFGALLTCMGVDFLSGSLVALVFHKSKKTGSGAYNSAYGLKGLCRKGLMLLLVLVGVQTDALLGVDYTRNAVCLGLCANEILSIVENLGLAGIPMPRAIVRALEQLQEKE
ncbi:MAG: phage holin family protein [Eubacteriales bacterium]|nr:phage holin family protein [Eubacteriales bacterium]